MRIPAMVFAVALTSVATRAAEVRVTVEDHSSGRRCTEHAAVSAFPDNGEGTITSALLAGERFTLINLVNDRPWHLRLGSEGCWSTTATWIPPAEPMVKLETFLSATLQGTFSVGNERPPTALRASAFPIARGRAGQALHGDPETLDCSVDYPKWQCVAPAQLAMDIRLEPPGFAPSYFWNVVVEAHEQRDVGQQKLVAGSSLAGWVQDAEGSPLPDATVTLSILQSEHPEAGRAGAAQHAAKTNARGFFQLSGVEAGEYRLASQATNHSPVVIPALTIQPSTALTWPRVLTHLPPVELTVTIDPPTNLDGSSWTVRLQEGVALVPGAPPVTVTLSPVGEGLWSGSALRADRYQLFVVDRDGSVVEERLVDLSNAMSATLALSIHPIVATGVITVGGQPLGAARVRFTNGSAKTVYITSDEDGRFEAVFPAPGRWVPTVYPHGRTRSTNIRATAIEVVTESNARLEMALPGGRIRGKVAHDGTPAKAAVHVVRDGSLVAQEVTNDDGKFDFIALAEAAYSIDAEGEPGATVRPVDVRVRKNETTNVDLALATWKVIRATVSTPTGRPASGAMARVSFDGGISWSEQVLGMQGEFEYHVPSGVMTADLIVVTYSYPAAMARIIIGNGAVAPLALRLAPHGGKVQVKPDRAYVIRQNAIAPVQMFYLPMNLSVGPIAYLEPGSYSVCRQPQISKECRQLLVAPGTSTILNLDEEEGK